jgi:hypothetical protein
LSAFEKMTRRGNCEGTAVDSSDLVDSVDNEEEIEADQVYNIRKTRASKRFNVNNPANVAFHEALHGIVDL